MEPIDEKEILVEMDAETFVAYYKWRKEEEWKKENPGVVLTFGF